MSWRGSGTRRSALHLVLAGLLLAAPWTQVLGLSASPDFAFESDQADALLGNYVSSAGDVNGDGYGDIFASAPRFDGPLIDEGRIYLFLGSATGLGAVPAWTFGSGQAGTIVRPTAAGDFDGDGYDDAIVAAPRYNDDQSGEGRVWIFRGGPAGLETTPFWVADGNQVDADFGLSVASAGDVNGDGFDDVLIGAQFFDNGEVDEGAAFLYFGSPSGPSTTADWMAEGNQAGAIFGNVAAAGDVNGDGYDDFLIGASFFDDGEVDEGAAFLYLGSRNGPRRKVTMLTISEPSATFGSQLGTAGDVNGDGFDDIVVTAHSFLGTGFDERVFVYFGKRPVVSQTPSQVLRGGQGNIQFGIGLDTAGDVNGDGFDDVIVGGRAFDGAFINQGRAFVFAGSPDGLGLAPYWTFDGTQPSEEVGVATSTAGDVNGDGFSDVLVGAHAWDNPEVNEGRILVFHGGP